VLVEARGLVAIQRTTVCARWRELWGQGTPPDDWGGVGGVFEEEKEEGFKERESGVKEVDGNAHTTHAHVHASILTWAAHSVCTTRVEGEGMGHGAPPSLSTLRCPGV
jgi:hypothetical protein